MERLVGRDGCTSEQVGLGGPHVGSVRLGEGKNDAQDLEITMHIETPRKVIAVASTVRRGTRHRVGDYLGMRAESVEVRPETVNVCGRIQAAEEIERLRRVRDTLRVDRDRIERELESLDGARD